MTNKELLKVVDEYFGEIVKINKTQFGAGYETAVEAERADGYKVGCVIDENTKEIIAEFDPNVDVVGKLKLKPWYGCKPSG